jgi:PKD repeat protein
MRSREVPVKRRSKIFKILVFVGVMLVVMLGLATTVGAWSEGTDPNGWGTHDWILKTANELAGKTGAGWVNMAVAQPVSDDPDTVYRDSGNHIYDNWGLLKMGTAPAAVRDHYAQAVSYLKAGNVDEASRQVALMAHYYDDIWNPFHTSYELSTLGVQSRYHTRYEADVLGHEPASVTWDGFTPVTDAAAATIAAADVSRTYFSILSNAYTSGSGYGATGVDSTTKMLLGRAANGLADLIASIQADAGPARPNNPPVAVAGANPTNGAVPLTVAFSSAGSTDTDGTIVAYDWDFGDSSIHSSNANPSHPYTATGTYVAVLTVTDDDAATGTATVTITVSEHVNQPPKAVAGANPTSGIVPLTVAFSSAGSTDTDGTIVAYDWDFGDSSIHVTDANPSHPYTTAGTYMAKLTVTDNGGATGTATVTVKVMSAAQVIRVDSITLSVSSTWLYRTVRASVLITDAGGVPVGNATVSVRWSGTTSGTATATTGSNGIATLSKSFWASSGKVTLAVTGVSKTSCTYDAGQNKETQDSIAF